MRGLLKALAVILVILVVLSSALAVLGGLIAGILQDTTWLATLCGFLLGLGFGLAPFSMSARRLVEPLGEPARPRGSRPERLETLSEEEGPAIPEGAAGSAEAPAVIVDRVHFTVTAPPIVKPDYEFVADIWAHLEEQRDAVVSRAQQGSEASRLLVRSRGPTEVARGTVLTVRLSIGDLIVEEPEDTILWVGEIGNATFSVKVPDNATLGPKRGLASVMVNGLRIARIDFVIHVGTETVTAGAIDGTENDYRTAFASYASEDRNDVLRCIQGLQKARPSLDIFIDVDSLRAGQHWEQEIHRTIPSRDVFYLFWSSNARESHWVEQEWRCALEHRGLDFIDPFPLVSPQVAPPPEELAGLHFNDKWLYFRRRHASPEN